MKYKVICSDLDGTLLNSKSELSAENKAAIIKLREMGIIFVPAIGRTLFELPLSVANANPAAKASADKTICSNDGHIAKYILENFVLIN